MNADFSTGYFKHMRIEKESATYILLVLRGIQSS